MYNDVSKAGANTVRGRKTHLPHPQILVFRRRDDFLPDYRLALALRHLLSLPLPLPQPTRHLGLGTGLRGVVVRRVKLERLAGRAEVLDRGEALLEVAQLEGEARADLLQRDLFRRAERVPAGVRASAGLRLSSAARQIDRNEGEAGGLHAPVAAEEKEVALVVEGDDLPALELGHGREERLEEAADGVPKPGDEPIEDELRVVRR